jgi:hypothetical protein
MKTNTLISVCFIWAFALCAQDVPTRLVTLETVITNLPISAVVGQAATNALLGGKVDTNHTGNVKIDGSFAQGPFAAAPGNMAIAMGSSAYASGQFTFAGGTKTTNSGDWSWVWNCDDTSNYVNSTANSFVVAGAINGIKLLGGPISGNAANLTNLPAAQLTGSVPSGSVSGTTHSNVSVSSSSTNAPSLVVNAPANGATNIIDFTDGTNLKGGIGKYQWTDGTAGVFGVLDMHTYDATGNSFWRGRRARGTMASPTVVQTGDYLSSFSAMGWDGTRWNPHSDVTMDFFVSSNFTETSHPTYIIFKTTPIGSTNKAEAVRIQADKSTLFSGYIRVDNNTSAAVPSAPWTASIAPGIRYFGGTSSGDADILQAMASSTAGVRPVVLGRRAKGTLASPSVVANADEIYSVLASGYDGSAFQNASALSFIVDGTPSSGQVPISVSFLVGSNSASRLEKMKIRPTGEVLIGNTVAATNGYYFPSNGITVATVAAGMTNGASWMGMMSNALQVAWMSNNVVTWKIIAP